MKQQRRRWRTLGLLLCAASLSACGPSEKQKAEAAELKRIECLDKFCYGDVDPMRDYAKDALLKLNGQWFIGPKEYFSGQHGAVFYWPSKTPEIGLPDGKDYPEKGKPFKDVAIEIFLRHHDGVMHGPNRIDILKQAEAGGRLVNKKTIRPGLEQWRVKDEGELDPGIWYVATDYVAKEPNAAVVWCRATETTYGICYSSSIFAPGIAWDMRFSAKHAQDWPEIFLETTRVLQLLKKV